MNTHSSYELISPLGFMPHGMCYLWRPDILALNIISDGFIALAYFLIAFSLLYIVRKRADRQFDWMLMWFAAFIMACGLTHVMDIWTIWTPVYWIAGAIKAITAIVSVSTAVLLLRLVPSTLRLPSPLRLQHTNRAMQREIDERVRAEAALLHLNRTLELRVAERTAQMETANRALQVDYERFALAADAAGLAFWSFDIAANTLKWDERMYQLYGVSPMHGEQTYDLWAKSLHADDKERCEAELKLAIDGAQAFDTEFRIVQPNGGIRHIRATARITRDGAGTALQMFGVNFDITERKRADEHFRLAIDAAPTGMLLMNRTGAIVLANVQIETLFGYSRVELLGRQIELLVPERFREHHPEFRKDFFDAPRSRPMGAGRDLYGLRKDGSEMPIEIGLTPLQTSEGMFVLSSIVDLTQRREIDRLRSDFVSTVSHELRTPLTSISGSLGLLQSGTLGELPPKAAEMVEIAHKNSARLVRIINDILDIGRLEAGQLAMQMSSVSLEPLLRQAVEANSGYAQKYGVRFLLDSASGHNTVWVDADRLMQVITNLLSNAAKFSPSGADVHVRSRPEANTVRVEVEDAGSGIPEEFRGRIFEKFAQADASAARRFEGTGLGLSIARKLIEAMGGTIGFDSVAGRGSVFYVELLRTAAAPAVASAAVIPRILYIEVDQGLTDVIRESVDGKAELVHARGLREAERRLCENKFDMVILNQSAPDSNEDSLLKRIPELIGHAVPVVLLASEVPALIHANVSAVLIKSHLSAERLAATILSHLPR